MNDTIKQVKRVCSMTILFVTAVLYALRALDPCMPLGVLECARWALSMRAMDGLCVVLVSCYALASVLLLGVRALTTQKKECTSAVHTALFWPTALPTKTYYVKLPRKVNESAVQRI
jgi:hypothetical protein